VGRRRPDKNVTLRLDPDIVMWAGIRALTHGTSLNGVVRVFLEKYAAVPDAWWEGKPPPWTPGGRSEAGWSVGDPLPDELDGENLLVVEAVAAVTESSGEEPA
jgi:hypothetical protein